MSKSFLDAIASLDLGYESRSPLLDVITSSRHLHC